MTSLSTWQKLPNTILAQVYFYLDPTSTKQLSLTDMKARKIFLSSPVLKELLSLHLQCTPSTSMPWQDQYLGLSVARSLNGRVACAETISIEPHHRETMYFSISPNGERVTTSKKKQFKCLDRTATLQSNFTLTLRIHSLWDTNEQETIAVIYNQSPNELCLWDLTKGTCSLKIPTELNIHFVGLSPDGTRCITIDDNYVVKITDTTIGKNQNTLQGKTSEIGEAIIASNNQLAAIGYMDGYLDIWDLNSSTLAFEIKLRTPMETIKFSNDNSWFLAIGSRGPLRIWDLTKKTKKCLHTIPQAQNQVPKGFEITSDKRTVYVSYTDGTVKLFDLKTTQCLQTIKPFNTETDLFRTTPDGTTMWTGCGEGQLALKRLALARLPHERVHDTMMAASTNKPEAIEQFHDLPSHTKDFVTRKRTRNQATAPLTNPQIYHGLCQYNLNVFLPGIINLLKLEEAALVKPALNRFEYLPHEFKRRVYRRLAHLHKEKPEAATMDAEEYGKFAFHNKDRYSATNAERITAIQEAKRQRL